MSPFNLYNSDLLAKIAMAKGLVAGCFCVVHVDDTTIDVGAMPEVILFPKRAYRRLADLPRGY